LLARFHESQLTQSEFANQHGVGLSTLSKWLRLEREVPSPKVKFHEMRLPSPAACWPVARDQDHPDQRVHASGMGQGQSEGASGRVGSLTRADFLQNRSVGVMLVK
jgi:hypothetical protein